MPNESIRIQIQEIFDNNELTDLKYFLDRSDYLNKLNVNLNYIFHLIQSGGILVTTISAGYNNTNLIWLGVSLNALATLLHLYEKNNNILIAKMNQEIISIKDGTYNNQTKLIESDGDNEHSIPVNLVNLGANKTTPMNIFNTPTPTPTPTPMPTPTI